MQRSPFQLQWKGRRGFLIRLIEWITGLRRLDGLHSKNFTDEKGLAFVTKTLEVLGIEYEVESRSIRGIPPDGPLVVVANHPFGGAEGLAIIEFLLKNRPDTKVLANQLLNALPGMKELFIGVDILGEVTPEKRKQANKVAVDKAIGWVKNGGVLLVFPAGEVARWDWREKVLKEAPWRHTAGRILKESGATLQPIYVEGKNSRFFYGLGSIHPMLKTAWLVRELINKKGKTFMLRLGQAEPASCFEKLTVGEKLTNTLRMHTLLLSGREKKKHSEIKGRQAQVPVIEPVDESLLAEDMEALDQSYLLLSKRGYQVWCAPSKSIPHVFQEIARLREMTFRAAGEGTGFEVDRDEFDNYYLHLFIWRPETREVVGAYRIGLVDEVISHYGVEGLYSRSLFQFDEQFLQKLGPCLEMGRSFIRPEYQKSLMPLQLLWKGISAWVVEHPKYRVLFGPVSISSDYQELSRYLMAMSLEQNHFNSELADLVQPSQPMPRERGLPWNREMLAGLGDVDQLSSLVQVLENGRGVPVLLRQYLKLNGSFVGFNVDKEFNDALDGLIIVDLLNNNRRAVTRYLGEEGYRTLYAYHKGANRPVQGCVEG